MLDIDAVYSEIGDLGPQQVRYAVAFLLFNAYASWHMLQFSFVGYAIKFECYTADQDTPYYNVCPANDASKCSKINFANVEEETTIVSEWDLICDREWLAGATMSAFMAGVMFGAPLLGMASDAIGRRKGAFTYEVRLGLEYLRSTLKLLLFDTTCVNNLHTSLLQSL